MTQESRREIALHRTGKGRYVARNVRGGELAIGEGDDEAFSPVELLLAAIAGCASIDVDHLTTKRTEPEGFGVAASAEKIRDDQGNRLVDIRISVDVAFPDSDAGTAATERLPNAVRVSHDRLCTVSRTVEVGTPVAVEVVGQSR